MKKIYVANWKMNGTKRDVENYVELLSNHLFLDTIILAFPFVYLDCAHRLISPCLRLGAQDLSHNSNGAHTGEISGAMLKNIGCEYVIIGHSERRAAGDNNEMICQKMAQAIENNLLPILCVGETLEQRNRGKTNDIVYQQLEEGLASVSKNKSFIIAYEPIWAIGTGQVATLTEIAEACAFIHTFLEGHKFLDIPVLYGGSVTPENSYHLKTCAHVSGFLVGGASLKAELFLGIIQ